MLALVKKTGSGLRLWMRIKARRLRPTGELIKARQQPVKPVYE
jgi:hypothetical protein